MGVIERAALGGYQGAMTTVAAGAALASWLPGGPARWRALEARLGRLEPSEDAAGALWVHAASVGELMAVCPLVRRLGERLPEGRWVFSTLTRTGLALARDVPEAERAFLLPLDAPGRVRRVVRAVVPTTFLFTETEIWPSLLHELAAQDVPTFMVSGRVSERTVRWRRWLRPLFRPALEAVTCCMQTDDDARRIVALGADSRRVHVAGSLKFDGGPGTPSESVERLRAVLAREGRRLLVAGSTHAGEDEVVLAAYRRVAAAERDLLLLLAPRHPERLDAVASLVQAAGVPLVRYGTLARVAAPEIPEGPAVILLDVIGPLAQCYELATVAFVGGSLVPVGGHNVLEPARAGRPVLVGPHTQSVGDVVDRLVVGGGALRVSSEESLAWAISGLLTEPGRGAEMGRRARALGESGQGAVERHVKIIAARLSAVERLREQAGAV